MVVYGLVGKSGTGKSYQSMALCKERRIESIIDDGLFIYKNTVQAGTSAKREDTKIGAIKAALFQDESRRREVEYKIKELQPKSILVLGTSEAMIERIVERLDLPPVKELIRIEDISSADEIATALRQRNELGKHVIPAPSFELKPQFSGYFLAPLKIFRGRGSSLPESEKSVVRPTYSYMGHFSISDKAVGDIIIFSSKAVSGVISVTKVFVNTRGDGIDISITVILKYGCNIINTAQQMQEQIAENVGEMTAFNIHSVNVEIKGLQRGTKNTKL